MSAKTHLFLCLKDNYGVLVHDQRAERPRRSTRRRLHRSKRRCTRPDGSSPTSWSRTTMATTPGASPSSRNATSAAWSRHARRWRASPLVDEAVGEGDVVKVGKLAARVIETPGHTAGHITYWFDTDALAFAGDTLFSIGCGRVIEGTPEMMWQSLLKLSGLPGETRVYCGHEYTLANIRFAQTIEPDNPALARPRRRGGRAGAGRKPTIPTTLDRGEGRQPVPARRSAGGRGRRRAWRASRRRRSSRKSASGKTNFSALGRCSA